MEKIKYKMLSFMLKILNSLKPFYICLKNNNHSVNLMRNLKRVCVSIYVQLG